MLSKQDIKYLFGKPNTLYALFYASLLQTFAWIIDRKHGTFSYPIHGTKKLLQVSTSQKKGLP
jgi:hypothetical protein